VTANSDVGALWIRRYHPAPHAVARLLCFPHAGSAANFYFGASRRLTPQVEVLAVQYPGRQDRHGEPAIGDVTKLVPPIVEAARRWTDRPLALFGHSLGALLAFEVARRLEQEGVKPVGLFLSARRAAFDSRPETVHQRDDVGLLAEMRALGGTDDVLLDDEELLREILPMVRSDYRAAETYVYRPGPDVSCPVVAFAGADDPKATPDEIGAWARHTSGGFELRVFPGGHFYLKAHQNDVFDAIRERVPQHI
jgi:surfactin synthase thioesterase subunit